MGVTIIKDLALAEDLETGFGATAQGRSGNKINAGSIPFESGKSIEEALNERPTNGESGDTYALKNGSIDEEFKVSQGTSPQRAVQKQELDNAPYAPFDGDVGQTFEVANATTDAHAMNRGTTQALIGSSLAPYAPLSNVLALDNITFYQPAQSYHPATKQYVDERVQGFLVFQGEDTVANILLKPVVAGHAWQATDAGTIPGTDPVLAGDMIAGDNFGAWINLGPITGVQGPQGIQGEAATADAGTTTTGAEGTNANVVNSGTVNDAIFDFTIPRGDTGAQGIQGVQGITGADSTVPGPQGIQGPIGVDGPIGPTGLAATIAVGAVTSLPSGTAPTVDNSGTSGAAIFDFGLEAGVQGTQGIQGIKGDAGTGFYFQGDITVAEINAFVADPAEGFAWNMLDAGSITYGTTPITVAIGDIVVWGSATTSFANLGAVQGPQGDQGIQGPAGADGADSTVPGPAGVTPTITVGTVTSLPSGTTPTIVDSGVAPNAVFDFGLEAGVQGTAGTAGTNGTNGTGWTSGAYDGVTGIVTFASSDGLGFSTTDLRGAAGTDGVDGAQGIPGDPGVDGADGATGAQGIDGPTGPTGPAGADGATGATGPAGPGLDTWVSFNVAGTILSSANVASVTRAGNDYTITFSTPMASTAYAAAISGSSILSSSGTYYSSFGIKSKTTTAIVVSASASSGDMHQPMMDVVIVGGN